MNGRIETYTHSDSTTPNKGGALVAVICDTDFGARTPEFVDFTRSVARWAYGAVASTWLDLCAVFPEAEARRREVEGVLREKVLVKEMQVVRL
jgi:translation elongation factor EF-Ts